MVTIPESMQKREKRSGSNPKSYTTSVLDSYDAVRHIEVGEAYRLVRDQEDKALPVNRLERAVRSGELLTYEFDDGKKYVDRLDIGRVYHKTKASPEGMRFSRRFATRGEDPLQSVGPYKARDLQIKDFRTGEPVWEMKGAEFPASWDDDEVGQQIVAQKYFFKPRKKEWKRKLEAKLGRGEEYSIAHLVRRVTDFFTDKGWELGYFASEEDREAFRDDLAWLQINRMFAFNSPVQFNAGIHNTYGVEGSKGINYYRDPKTGEVKKVESGEYVHPQCHACFIKGPRDNLESIANHNRHEVGIFAAGSGIGQDIGTLREEGAPLSGGGRSSGSLSFLGIYDKGAGAIKSGGKSRRAARMTTMNSNHPDVSNFAGSKVREDYKALILAQSGKFGGVGMDEEPYRTVSLQNTNISVRFQAGFFETLEMGGDIELRSVKTGEVLKTISADRLLKEMAFGTWRVGDPGAQYADKIDEMHTAKNSGRQKSTNPCGEYMFLDDTSCNLASLNLLAFSDQKGNFDVDRFRKAARIISTAQDIANSAASMPVRDIAEISPEFRTIGIGYANVGSLLMRKGLAYDSDEGRNFVSAITAVMTGASYEASTELAEKLEPFTHFEFNRKPMLEVIGKHRKSLDDVVWEGPAKDLQKAARESWNRALSRGKKYGYRNAQVSVIAPTGTIIYLMDGRGTTGIEPAPSLTITKNLAGGGNLTLTNGEVPNALRNLGYQEDEIRDIVEYVEWKPSESSPARATVRGAPHLSPDHYAVFDTAFGSSSGDNSSISPEGHIRMVAAAQPFVSGGISKTMNFPEKTTVKDFYDAFVLSHRLGLKGFTAFRDKSKPAAALAFSSPQDLVLPKRGQKVDLPGRRKAFETEVKIIDGEDGTETPIHVISSDYKNGLPGQITFLSYKEGSTLGALLKTSGISASKALKRGVSLEDVTDGWIGQEFRPKGRVTGHPHIKFAKSPLDLAAKILRLEYLGETEVAEDSEAVRLEDLWGYSSGAFHTLDREKVDAWDIEQVLRDPEYGGFVKKEGDERKKGAPTNGNGNRRQNNNERGLTCITCGNIMKQTSPNCYKCNSCGEQRGGCGL